MTMKTEFHIVEDFRSVQGEGHYSGTFAQFVRLAGCNSPSKHLDCVDFCDTDYDVSRWTSTLDGFEDWFGGQAPAPLLIFTGGEPLLYQDLLYEWITASRYLRETQVCIETNGTIDRDIPSVWHTVSPKGPLYRLGRGPISEIKLVVTPEHLRNGISTSELLSRLSDGQDCELYLQPLDNDLELARDIVERLISRRPEWKLSLQTHKLISML